MDVFWNTIAAYNAATWPVQLLLVAVAAVLTLLLYLRPTRAVRVAMKVFMAALNFWIAVYIILSIALRANIKYGCLWAVVSYVSCRLGGRTRFARAHGTTPPVCSGAVLYAAPYPLFSLALGRTFPMMTSPVMPCSSLVFTVALMLAFSERANIVLATLLCHWALIGFSKVYFFGFPRIFCWRAASYPLSSSFRRYIRNRACESTKPSPRVLNALLAVLCAVIGVCCSFLRFLHQFDLFTEI